MKAAWAISKLRSEEHLSCVTRLSQDTEGQSFLRMLLPLETSSSKEVGSKHQFLFRVQWRTLPSWTPVSSLPEKGESYSFSRVWLLSTPWIVAHQAPLSMGYSRQEYWSGLPFPSPGDLPYPGIKLGSPALQADSLLSEPPTRHEELRTPAGHRASPLPGHKRDTTPFLFSYFFKSVINIFIDLFQFFQVYEYIINL